MRGSFRAFVARELGEEGAAWLAALPTTVETARRALGLALGPELPGGLLSFVCEATTGDGVRAVLKIAGPWDRPRDEATCLRVWAGRGAPRLLDDIPELGALLLERVDPGTPTPGAATDVARLFAQLHCQPVAGLRELEDVVRGRLARVVARSRVSADRAARAAEVLAELAQGSPPVATLHGDIDDRNLLMGEHGLVAIDPLPCIGDPAYDAALWAHASGAPGRRERQRAIAAHANLDPERVRRWGIVVTAHG